MRLEEPADHIKYKIALQRIPPLQLLRTMYMERVIHSSPEQWKSDVIELFRFNLTTQDNAINGKNNNNGIIVGSTRIRANFESVQT